MKQIVLEQLISTSNKYDEGLNVIFKEHQNISLKSVCLLVSEEELENMPEIFNLILGLDIFNDILENLHLQKPKYTKAEALEAIIFYINNDAFIELSD